MRPSVISRMSCVACNNTTLSYRAFNYWREDPEVIDDGIIWCANCQSWYPIENGVAEFLTPELHYQEDRSTFAAQYDKQLRELDLNLSVPTHQNAVVEQLKQQRHFDWYAENEKQSYDAYENMTFWRCVDEVTFSEWHEQIKPLEWVLDVGCAQGRSSFPFLDLDIQHVGIDISKSLIRQAVMRYRRERPRARATFLVADANKFPFHDDVFDHVLIYGVLHHLPDVKKACCEIARVLKIGGTYLGSENNRTRFRRIFDYLQKISPIWHEEAGAEPLVSSTDLRKWFEPCRFELETSTHVFVPPHLVNMLGRRRGRKLLNWTDRLGKTLPYVRDNGGLIMIKGHR